MPVGSTVTDIELAEGLTVIQELLEVAVIESCPTLASVALKNTDCPGVKVPVCATNTSDPGVGTITGPCDTVSVTVTF
jgi:hypothetical protein